MSHLANTSYLLDTHTLIWALTDPEKLSETAKSILLNDTNEIVVSAISFWEISIRHSIQKLTLDGLMPEDFPKAAVETGFRLIDLYGSTAATYHHLSATHHRDPFDRILITQSQTEQLLLITADANIHQYEVEWSW